MNKSGANFILPIKCNVDVSRVSKAIFTLRGNAELAMEYPEVVTFADGYFFIPLTQENTYALAGNGGKNVLLEGQINFDDLSVIKTKIVNFYIYETLATVYVDGNTPSAYSLNEVELSVKDGIIIAHVDVKEVDDAVEKANEAVKKADISISKADIATKKANDSADRADESAQTAENASRDAIVATNNAISATENANTASERAEVASDNAETATVNAEKATADTIKATQKAESASAKAETSANKANEATSKASNVNINAVQNVGSATITVTDNNGTPKSVEINDGKDYVITEADYEAIADVVEPKYTKELSSLKEDIAKTDRSLDALWKLNKGQTYDIETKEENGMNDVPSGAEFVTMEDVYGKSEQISYSGKNLYCIQPKTSTGTTTICGLTCTFTDSTLVAQGTATSAYKTITGVDLDLTNINEGKTYSLFVQTVGTCPRALFTLAIKDENGDNIAVVDKKNLNSAVVTTLQGFDASLIDATKCRYTIEGVTVGEEYDFKTEFMLFEGDYTASNRPDYEPYTGGIPSPNPEFPQEIRNVEELNFEISGRQLIQSSIEDISFHYDAGQGQLSIQSISSKIKAPLNSSKTFVLSFRTDWTGAIRLQLQKSSYVNLGNFTIENGIAYKVFTVPETHINPSNVLIQFSSNSITGDFYIKDVMLEKGENRHDYVPYFEPITRTITPPFPMNAIGDYKDMLDVDNGVWRKNCDKVLLKGNGISWNGAWDSAYHIDGTFIVYSQAYNNKINRYGRIMCNYFKSYLTSELRILNQPDTQCQIGNGSAVNIAFRFPTTLASNVDEWKDFLDSNDVYIYYSMQEPTTEPISAEDMEFFKSLELTPTDHHITVTDQNGNDIEWLAEYIISLREVN